LHSLSADLKSGKTNGNGAAFGEYTLQAPHRLFTTSGGITSTPSSGDWEWSMTNFAGHGTAVLAAENSVNSATKTNSKHSSAIPALSSHCTQRPSTKPS